MDHDHSSHTLVFTLPDELPKGAQFLVTFSINEKGEVSAVGADRFNDYESWGPPIRPVRVCDKATANA